MDQSILAGIKATQATQVKKGNPDERQVYLTLRHIFTEVKQGSISKSRVFRKKIEQHQHEPDLALLLQKYTIEGVSDVARTLFTAGVFHSPSLARTRMPHLFDKSTVEGPANETSDTTNDAVSPAEAVIDEEPPAQDAVHQPAFDAKAFAEHLNGSIVDIPIQVQRHLLLFVQSVLEQICFNFSEANLPELTGKRWSCAEALALFVWLEEAQGRHAAICRKQELPRNEFLSLLQRLKRIEIVGSDRIALSVRVLHEVLVDAVTLALLLEGSASERMQPLITLQDQVQAMPRLIRRRRESIASGLKKTLQEIAAKGADLDRAEFEAYEDAYKKDVRYCAYTNDCLAKIVSQLRDKDRSEHPLAKGLVSDADIPKKFRIKTSQVCDKKKAEHPLAKLSDDGLIPAAIAAAATTTPTVP